MKDSIYYRLELLLEKEKISGNKFDLLCGFSKGYIRKVIKYKYDIGYFKILRVLEVFTEYSPQWLFLGKGKIKLLGVKNDRFLQTLSNIQEKYPSICVTDSNGRILHINDSYTKQTGFTLKDIKGKRPGDYLQRSDFPEEMQIRLMRLLKKGDPFFEKIALNYTKIGFPIVCNILVFPVIYKYKVIYFISFANFEKE